MASIYPRSSSRSRPLLTRPSENETSSKRPGLPFPPACGLRTAKTGFAEPPPGLTTMTSLSPDSGAAKQAKDRIGPGCAEFGFLDLPRGAASRSVVVPRSQRLELLCFFHFSSKVGGNAGTPVPDRRRPFAGSTQQGTHQTIHHEPNQSQYQTDDAFPSRKRTGRRFFTHAAVRPGKAGFAQKERHPARGGVFLFWPVALIENQVPD